MGDDSKTRKEYIINNANFNKVDDFGKMKVKDGE